MAPLLTESQSACWTVWLLGELFGYNHAAPAAAFGSWCADLERGCEQPESLNGHFLILAADRRDGSWHAWTDRLGTAHLYHASSAGRSAFGTFHPAVAEAASARKLDWVGLAGFFAFGFFPEDRTFFEDVKIVRPATHIAWDRRGTKTKESRYWTWNFDPDPARSYSDTIDAFGETLRRILRDQTSTGRIVLPLSSGLDSRTVAAVVSAGGAPRSLSSYSYGYTDDSAETRIAHQVATARGIAFDRFTIQPYLFDRLDTVLASVEGFQNVTTTRQAAVSAEIGARGDYLLAAHWGDVWMDDAGLPKDVPVSETLIVDHSLHKIEKPGRQWLLDRMAARHIPAAQLSGVLRECVVSELGRLNGIDDAGFRVKAFKTEQWSFRWTVPSLRMFQPAAFPRLPFYDNRMVDLCSTIPSSFVAGRRLQIDYLKRHHPDLARVTWDVSDSTLFLERYRNSLLLPKRAVKKVGRMLMGTKPIIRNWEVQFFAPGMRSRLEACLLSPGSRIGELVSDSDLKALVSDLYVAPTGANGYTVSQLLTLSAWLERYG